MKIKPKRCREKAPGCHGEYTPWSSFQATCRNPGCAAKKAKRDREKREALAAKTRRSETAEAKKSLMKISQVRALAQRRFNKFIRLRDKDQPCISCGRPPGDNGYLTGGTWDAGHYLSRAARPWLAFDERNCWKQCKRCNRDHSGSAGEMRIEMVKRIGEAAVVDLENTQPPDRTWTREELYAIEREYRERIKLIEKSLQ